MIFEVDKTVRLLHQSVDFLRRKTLALLFFCYIPVAFAGMLTDPPISISGGGNETQEINVPAQDPGILWSVVKIALDYDAEARIAADSTRAPSFVINGPLGTTSPAFDSPGDTEVVDSATITWVCTTDPCVDPVTSIITLNFVHTAAVGPPQAWEIQVENNDSIARSFFIADGHSATAIANANDDASVSYLDDSNVVIDSAGNFNFGKHIIHSAPIQNNQPGIPLFEVCNRGTGDLGFTSATPSDAVRFQVLTNMASLTVNPVDCTNILLQFTPADTVGESTASLQFVFDNPDQSPQTFSSLKGTSEKLELVLTLDISGSMSWQPDGTPIGSTSPGADPPDGSRLHRLKEATSHFIGVLYDHATENNTHDPSAAIATVVFPGTAGSDLTETVGGLSDLDTAERDANTAAGGIITTLPVGNWNGTPMGEGLSEAAVNFSALNFHRHALFLFTDGAHNTGKDPEHVDIVGPCDPNPVSTPDGIIQNKNIVLYPFAYGNPGTSNVDHELLTRISQCSRGDGVIYSDPGTGDSVGGNLITYFNNVLAELYDMQLAEDPNAAINIGATNVHAISVTEYDRTASFTVAWEPTNQEKLLTYIETPNGTKIENANRHDISIYEGASYRTIIVRGETLTAPDNIGDWRLHVKYQQQADNASATLRYSYDAMLSSALRMDTQFSKGILNTGDTVSVSASLREKGLEIKGAEVFVVVERPDDGLGNWFADNVISEKDLEKIPTTVDGEPLSLLDRKTNFLRLIKQINIPSLIREEKVKLYDDGTHGDKYKNDGIYTNSADVKIRKEGMHTFQITANGLTKAGSRFQRQSLIQKVAVVELDPKVLARGIIFTEAEVLPFFPASLKEILETPVPEGYVRKNVVFAPKDSGGNFWGPGHADEIKFKFENAKAIGPVVGILSGVYVQVIEYEKGATPSTIIKVRDLEVKPLIPLASDHDLPLLLWLLWLVIILAI